MLTEPIRILQIGMTHNYGGIETFLLNIYKNIDRSKIQFDFIDMYNGIAFCEEIKKLGGNIYFVPFFKKHPIKNFFALYRLIKRNKYNVIHSNMLSCAYILPLIAAKLAGVKKIIAHSHSSSTDRNLLRHILHYINKPFLRFFANIYCSCSKEAARWLFTKSIRGRVTAVKNAINVEDFIFNRIERDKKRKELNLDGKIVFGAVSRFSKTKNHSFMIDVFEEIYKINDNSFLLLIGSGDLENNIKQKVSNKKLQENVLFLGMRSDIASLLWAIDAFLMPSLYEGLPIVGIEAQASGLPCFFSDAITDELNIANAKFISLKKNAKQWADYILKTLEGFQRENTASNIIKAGFNIRDAVSIMSVCYTKSKI
jgi:glycosyltransferase involved in cell wall biosynthesis